MRKLISFFLMFISMEKAHALPIYGEDNRQDLFEATIPTELKLMSQRSAAMFAEGVLYPMMVDGKIKAYRIQSVAPQSVCKEEKFSNQIVAASCSGFLLDDRHILTAGHCVSTAWDCSRRWWAFNYKMNDENHLSEIRKDDVYRCETLLAQVTSQTVNADYSIIRLDRPVVGSENFPKFKIRESGVIEKGSIVAALGYPNGLPLKVTSNGIVTDSAEEDGFISSLDTFGGNSGSIVINQTTQELEGVLVAGREDTKTRAKWKPTAENLFNVESCDQSKHFEEKQGQEVVVKITAIPELKGLSSLYPENDDQIAIKLARDGRWNEVFKLINKKKVNIMVRDMKNRGETLVHLSIRQKNNTVLNRLLSFPTLPLLNARDGYGDLPIHMAINQDNIDMLKSLLEKKADMYETNEELYNSMALAIINEKPHLMRVLMSFGFNPNKKGFLSRLMGEDEMALVKSRLRMAKKYKNKEKIFFYQDMVDILKNR